MIFIIESAVVFVRVCPHAIWTEECCPDISAIHGPVLRGLPFAYAYIDDVLIARTSKEEHLRIIFERLATYGIIINSNKCLFGVPELDFLGHHISSQGITPLPDKVHAVRDFPQPTSQCKLRQFIIMVNFYHHFLPCCAELMLPLRPVHNICLHE